MNGRTVNFRQTVTNRSTDVICKRATEEQIKCRGNVSNTDVDTSGYIDARNFITFNKLEIIRNTRMHSFTKQLYTYLCISRIKSIILDCTFLTTVVANTLGRNAFFFFLLIYLLTSMLLPRYPYNIQQRLRQRTIIEIELRLAWDRSLDATRARRSIESLCLARQPGNP